MAKSMIQARLSGLNACIEAVEKVKEQCLSKANKAKEKYGSDSEQYNEAMTEYLEAAGTALRWTGMVVGRKNDLTLALAAETAQTAESKSKPAKLSKTAKQAREVTDQPAKSNPETGIEADTE